MPRKLIVTTFVSNDDDESSSPTSYSIVGPMTRSRKRKMACDVLERKSKVVIESSDSDDMAMDEDNFTDTGDDSEDIEGTESESDESDEPLMDDDCNISKSKMDDATRFLRKEPWYKELSEEDRAIYDSKLRSLERPHHFAPSLKDILDLEVSDDVKIKLVQKKCTLNTMFMDPEDFRRTCRSLHMDIEKIKNKSMSVVEMEIILETMSEDAEDHRMLERVLAIPESDIKTTLLKKCSRMYKARESSEQSEYIKSSQWLDCALQVPMTCKPSILDELEGNPDKINKALSHIQSQLNSKLYGMDRAKEEILLVLANKISNSASSHHALALLGPPGCGKTELIRSLAESLELPFSQISLGGVNDVTFLEGHSATYVGSEPGMIVKSLHKMKFKNGIIYFDEIDKLSSDSKSREVQWSLLHITDFTQNSEFRDQYMPEIPIDLSQIFFIYSLNSLDELDPALRNRLPIIELKGYDLKEKTIIIRDYVIPKILKNVGMNVGDIVVSDSCIKYLVNKIDPTTSDIGTGIRDVQKAINQMIKKINLYRLAAVEGNMCDLKLTYEIQNFALPLELTPELIDLLVTVDDNSIGKLPSKIMTMYS
jgi:ATP-dependent Lon protease